MPFRSSIAAVVDAIGPWADPISLPALRQLYFPLSRLWAAASVHPATDPRFVAETAPDLGRPIARGLAVQLAATVAAGAAAYRQALAAWEQGFFGAPTRAPDELAARETARRTAAARWMAGRAALTPLRMMAPVPPLRLELPAPGTVEAAYGRHLADPDGAYAIAGAMPEISCSPAIVENGTRCFWLRFPSPSARLADTAYAKVTEPADGPPRATVIAGNGVFVEPEMYPTRVLEIAGSLTGRGLRVIETMSPWHSRRTPPGWYGGERFFATAPIGALDVFTGQAQELAVLAAWCRQRFAGPLGFVGVSMSALVLQLALTRGRAALAAARPDAALLVLHSSEIEEVAFAGELVEALGLLAALTDAGWSRAALLRWLPLMAPSDTLAMPADRLVSLLAREDRVMPVQGGIAQLDRWGVPAGNRFVWAHSHMSVPAALRLDPAPIGRFVDLLVGGA